MRFRIPIRDLHDQLRQSLGPLAIWRPKSYIALVACSVFFEHRWSVWVGSWCPGAGLPSGLSHREWVGTNPRTPLREGRAFLTKEVAMAGRKRKRARQRTARYRAKQRGENVPKFPRGTPANPDSFHCRMESALRPWERVDEDLKERIRAKRRQILLAGGTWGDEEEEKLRNTWAGRIEKAKAEELEQFGSLLDLLQTPAEAGS
ncbi:hypothetical protein IAS59_006187 [Cryptococcus gattii]